MPTEAPVPLAPPPSFLTAAEAIGVDFDAGDVERLGRYLALLLDAAGRFNLTGVKDPDAAWTRHVLDSLTLLPPLDGLGAKTAIDVGSGGGAPGMVLAIVQPAVHFTLLEATGKKAAFLETAVAALGLSNVAVVNDRAETIGRDAAHRERYDVVTARAVGPLDVLLELAVPLAAIEGHVLAIKGARAAEEIEAARPALYLLHAHVVDAHPTPTGTIVTVRKMRRTPKAYPRRPGEPKRSPLGRGGKASS